MFPAEPVPDRIGAYKVIRRLSRTGSADVYLGLMEGPMGFRRVCELKIVASTTEGEAGIGEELGREAAICSRLNHPAILRVFDFFETDRRLVLVVEHLDGVDLERLVQHLVRRRQKLGDEAIWYIAHQLVGALSHAHQATDEDGNLTPVVHRNLAPDNVLVGWDGQVRLAGFGLGKILGRSPDSVVGTITGRPGYMAPEQARGERVTPRADVYGIGLLMWCLLTGRVPPMNGMRPEALSSVRPDVPREIAAAIEAALEPSPDRRKISCTEIEHWLKKITKVEAGRAELRDKIVLMRSTRSPLSDGSVEPPHTARPPAKVTGQRRRLSIRGPHAQQLQPAIARTPPSTRPPPRRTTTAPPPPGSEPPPSMRRYPSSEAPPAPEPSAQFERLDRPTGGARRIVRNPPARRAFGDEGEAPASFAPPVAAPDSVAPRGLASQPPPAMAFEPPSLGVPKAPPPPTFGDPLAEVSNGADASADEAPAEGAADAPVAAFEPAPMMFKAPIASAADDSRDRPTDLPKANDKGSRSLVLQSIVVAAITAAVIVGGGIYVAERRAPAPAPAPTTQVVLVNVPAPRASASASAAAPAAAPTASAASSANPNLLPGGFGYVRVNSPVPATVFVNGHRVGAVNEALEAQCGRRFIRIGTPSDAGPRWVAPGQTIEIPCQASIEITMKPAPSPPQRAPTRGK